MKEKTVQNLREIAARSENEVFKTLKTSPMGLYPDEAEGRILNEKEETGGVLHMVVRSFINPFTVILLIVATIALLTGSFGETDNLISAGIVFAIVIISGSIQCAQNVKVYKSFKKLGRFSQKYVTVKRGGVLVDVPVLKIVEGDIIVLSAGCKIPADARLVSGKDLRVSQAAITGESKITKKFPEPFAADESTAVPNIPNIVFGGSSVISGKGEAVVVATGKNTLFGVMPRVKKDNFNKGAGSIVKVLLEFMLVLVLAAMLVVGLTTRSFSSTALFTLSVAIGIVPEMLPMVVSVCLSKGSRAMMKKKMLVRNVNTMQGFAGMDVLCVDKTGTLTDNEITLEYYLDPFGNESEGVLASAYLNAWFSCAVGNYIDRAILKYKDNPLFKDKLASLSGRNKKLDEIPFGYGRKYSAVLLSDGERGRVVCKGNIAEILPKCSYVLCGEESVPMTADKQRSVEEVVGELLSDGMKVFAVAQKLTAHKALDADDETDMTLVGYLVFFDAPKKSAKQAIARLKNSSVDVIVLTGDDAETAVSVCKRIGIATDRVIKGAEIETLSDGELSEHMQAVKIFAELTPDQKVRIVSILKSNGHTVGYLGDGINDIPALCAADVAVSVDTAQDAAKDVADVLLLEKDLSVVADGIAEGRKVSTNVRKYIKITASSNFGNVLALVIASIFIPFQPMMAVQLLLLNMLYDLLCFTISWDNIDTAELNSAKIWSGKGLSRFTVYFGIVSTVFDVFTFLFLYFVLCPWAVGGSYGAVSGGDAVRFVAVFQTGWFIESMWSQILILNILRTKKLPFVQSRPSAPFAVVILAGLTLFTAVTFTPIGALLGFAAMPIYYFAFLVGAILLYIAAVLGVKWLYVRIFKEFI